MERQDRLPRHKREDKDTLHTRIPAVPKHSHPTADPVPQPSLARGHGPVVPSGQEFAHPGLVTFGGLIPSYPNKGGEPIPNTGYQPEHFTAADKATTSGPFNYEHV
jgi:hypothetical protein